MDPEILLIVSLFLTILVRLLHKYAVDRAKYLVGMELGLRTDNLSENKTLKESIALLQKAF